MFCFVVTPDVKALEEGEEFSILLHSLIGDPLVQDSVQQPAQRLVTTGKSTPKKKFQFQLNTEKNDSQDKELVSSAGPLLVSTILSLLAELLTSRCCCSASVTVLIVGTVMFC